MTQKKYGFALYVAVGLAVATAIGAPLLAQGSNPLLGQWSGTRPTNGYIWEIRFRMEFLPNGTYAYTAQQVSPRKDFWKLAHTGTYRFLPADARGWSGIVEIVPDRGSVAPPTEPDRTALYDVLGLPDERPHRFRYKLSQMGLESIEVQPTDANPGDHIEQTWHLNPVR